MTQHQSCESNPIAYVSIGRNRSKIYGDAVYVRDGQEFQLELFNPTTETIGAKVYLNGKAISESLIVIRPGERSWLERYLDDNKRFAFSTYAVENTEAAKKAIQDNGRVRVEFYKEKRPTTAWNSGTTTWQPFPYTYNPPTYNPFGGTITTAGSGYYSSTGGAGSTTLASGTSSSATGSGSSNTCHTANFSNIGSSGPAAGAELKSRSKDASVETGRVEKGSASGQSFNSYYGDFETWHFASIEYRLMPESQRPVEMKNIRNYCSECGVRIRKASWRHCPSCGNKLS